MKNVTKLANFFITYKLDHVKKYRALQKLEPALRKQKEKSRFEQKLLELLHEDGGKNINEIVIDQVCRMADAYRSDTFGFVFHYYQIPEKEREKIAQWIAQKLDMILRNANDKRSRYLEKDETIEWDFVRYLLTTPQLEFVYDPVTQALELKNPYLPNINSVFQKIFSRTFETPFLQHVDIQCDCERYVVPFNYGHNMSNGNPFILPKTLVGYFEVEESKSWEKRWIELSLNTYTVRVYNRKYDKAEIQKEKQFHLDELIDLRLKTWFDESPLEQKQDKIFYGLDIGIEGKTDWLRIRTIHPLILQEWREIIAQKWSQRVLVVKTGGFLPFHQYHFPINPSRTRMCDVKELILETVQQVNYGGAFLWMDSMQILKNALDQKVTIAEYLKSNETLLQKSERMIEMNVKGYYWVLQKYKRGFEEKDNKDVGIESKKKNLSTVRDNIAYKSNLINSDFRIDELMREEETPRVYMFNRMHEMLHELIKNGYSNNLTFDEKITEEEFKKQVHYHKDYPEILHLHASVLRALMEKVRERYYGDVHKKCGYPLSLTQVMALHLYTISCGQLTEDQRNGLYDKWKYWDHCLYWAIFRMCGHDQRQKEKYKLYTGWRSVELKQTQTNKGYFSTYCSASRDINIAKSFIQQGGCLLEFDPSLRRSFQLYSCDVEWVSAHKYENEVLFARGYAHTGYHNQEYWIAEVDKGKSTSHCQWIQLSARVHNYYEETLKIKEEHFENDTKIDKRIIHACLYACKGNISESVQKLQKFQQNYDSTCIIVDILLAAVGNISKELYAELMLYAPLCRGLIAFWMFVEGLKNISDLSKKFDFFLSESLLWVD